MHMAPCMETNYMLANMGESESMLACNAKQKERGMDLLERLDLQA